MKYPTSRKFGAHRGVYSGNEQLVSFEALLTIVVEINLHWDVAHHGKQNDNEDGVPVQCSPGSTGCHGKIAGGCQWLLCGIADSIGQDLMNTACRDVAKSEAEGFRTSLGKME